MCVSQLRGNFHAPCRMQGHRGIDTRRFKRGERHPLTLHVFADCWVRAFTSIDPQAWLLDSCRVRAAMLAGGGMRWVSGEREIVQN